MRYFSPIILFFKQFYFQSYSLCRDCSPQSSMDQKELKIQIILFNVFFFLHLQQNSQSRTQTINAQFSKVDQYRRKYGILIHVEENIKQCSNLRELVCYTSVVFNLRVILVAREVVQSKLKYYLEMLSREFIEEFSSYTFTVITLFKAHLLTLYGFAE